MINVESKYELNEFAEATMKSRSGIKKMLLIYSLCFFLLAIIILIIMLVEKDYDWLVTLIALIFASLVMLLPLPLFRPKSFAKRLLKFNPALNSGVTYKYEFNELDFIVEELIETGESKNKFNYSNLKKVIINNDYIFLYLMGNLCYTVKRKDINESDYNDLLNIFNNQVKKLRIKK